jgi:hypothetical protein
VACVERTKKARQRAIHGGDPHVGGPVSLPLAAIWNLESEASRSPGDISAGWACNCGWRDEMSVVILGILNSCFPLSMAVHFLRPAAEIWSFYHGIAARLCSSWMTPRVRAVHLDSLAAWGGCTAAGTGGFDFPSHHQPARAKIFSSPDRCECLLTTLTITPKQVTRRCPPCSHAVSNSASNPGRREYGTAREPCDNLFLEAIGRAAEAFFFLVQCF